MTLGALLDAGSRAFWWVTGRAVDLSGPERWLRAPALDRSHVGDAWLRDAADALGGTTARGAETGLFSDMACLDGPGFRADALRPQVRDFYEHTSAWRIDVWTQWNPLLQPGGALVARWFGRRVQQLAIPTRPLDVATGMDSRVVAILDDAGRQRASGWVRTLRSTGDHVYSGHYATAALPGGSQPFVHVSFPLERGNVQVFLRPQALADGSLALSSLRGPFGTEGAYVVVGRGGRHHAARVPLHERFRVYVDGEGVLRTDHVLRLGRMTAVRLHYRMARIG